MKGRRRKLAFGLGGGGESLEGFRQRSAVSGSLENGERLTVSHLRMGSDLFLRFPGPSTRQVFKHTGTGKAAGLLMGGAQC